MKVIYVSKEIQGTLKEAGQYFSSLINSFCDKRIRCFLIAAKIDENQCGKYWVAREQMPDEPDLAGFTYNLDVLCNKLRYMVYSIDTMEVYEEIYM